MLSRDLRPYSISEEKCVSSVNEARAFCNCRAGKSSCMLRPMIVREVALSAIEFEDETFRISEDLDLERMISSLRAVGQVHPVLLLERATSEPSEIVCGLPPAARAARSWKGRCLRENSERGGIHHPRSLSQSDLGQSGPAPVQPARGGPGSFHSSAEMRSGGPGFD